MDECPVCGSQNSNEALLCTLCGRLLGRADESAPPLPPGPLDPAVVARCNRSARNFALLMPTGLALWASAFNWSVQQSYPQPLKPLFSHPHFVLALILTGLVLVAYGVACTARVCGLPFYPGFLTSLFTPAIPGVLARATRRPLIENYIYLMTECIILYLLAYALSKAQPGTLPSRLALAGMITLMPLLIYHLCGGGLAQIAIALGLDPRHVLAWVCLGPVALCLGFLLERCVIYGLKSTGVGLGDCACTPTLLWAFFLITFLLWIRAVYDSLRNPSY